MTEREQPGDAADGLRLAERLRVVFSGQRGGQGPLTLNQAHLFAWVPTSTMYNRMFEWTLAMPDGTGLEDIAAALSVLMGRHESLRTNFLGSSGHEPVQRVARSGELALAVYEVTQEPSDLGPLAAKLASRMRATEFDLAAELPIRAAVAVRQGAPLTAVILCSHMAVDFAAMIVIDRQFRELASDPASRQLGPPGHQPLDQTAYERSPRGRSRAEAALRSWENQLRQAPQCVYSVPQDAAGGQESAGEYATGWLWSHAGALALWHIAARTGIARRVAVRAAVWAILARRTGQRRFALPTRQHNRFERHLRDYVGPAAHDGISSIDVSAVHSFDELIRHVAAASLIQGRSGLVDHAELIKVASEIEHDRGITCSRECAYNDLSAYQEEPARPMAAGDPAEVMRALGESRFSVTASGNDFELLLFVLDQVDGEMVLRAQTTNASRVQPQEIESVLRGVELLLAAAAVGDVRLDQLGEVTGVHPLPRGPGWVRIDSCWIELSQAQRLLDDALPGSAARVFVVPDPGGEAGLVAYLTATDNIKTPEQAHAACLALLPGDRSSRPPGGIRYTAMTPGRYVICTDAPDGRRDLAAWQRQAVFMQGSGRTAHPPRASAR